MENSDERLKNLPVAYENDGNTTITKEESHNIISQLKEQEEIIERGLRGLMNANWALKKIKDEKLYKENYATYSEYCRERWKYTPQYMNRLLRSSTLLETLKTETIVSVLPESEAQSNVLLKSENPAATWVKAQKETGKEQPTAKEIKASIMGQNGNDTIKAETEEKQDEATGEVMCEAIDTKGLDYASLLRDIVSTPYKRRERTGRTQVCIECDDITASRLGKLSNQLGSHKCSIVAQALIFMEKSLESISEDSIARE